MVVLFLYNVTFISNDVISRMKKSVKKIFKKEAGGILIGESNADFPEIIDSVATKSNKKDIASMYKFKRSKENVNYL